MAVDPVRHEPLSHRYSLYQGNLQGTFVGHRSRSRCKLHYASELCPLSEAERHLEQGISKAVSGNSVPCYDLQRGLLVLANSYILEGRGSMNTTDIIVEIDAQISRLQEAKALLAGTEITVKRKPGRPSRVSLPDKATRSISAKSATKPAARRTLSDEARAKIAAAQRARWAKSRKAAKKAARNVAAAPAIKRPTPNGAAPKTPPAKKAVSAKKSAQPKTKTPVTPAA
jgi:hypothetical protein